MSSVPQVPYTVSRVKDREIPRWGPTYGSVAMFVFIWLVFGSGPFFGFLWALVNDRESLLIPMGGIFGVPLTVVVVVVVYRMFRTRGVIKNGEVACCEIFDMVHNTRHGSVLGVNFSYRLLVGGQQFTGTGLVREMEMRALAKLPTNFDFAIVTYDPQNPKRNALWGVLSATGELSLPGVS